MAKLVAEEVDLGTITVQGKPRDREARKRARETYSGSIIYPDKVETASKTVSDLLAEESGVQIKRYGNRSDLLIRGANANQLKLYINGLPVSDSAYSVTELDQIPLEAIERIEIYKNSAPAHFSTSQIGGVVNIVTKRSLQDARTLTLGYGSFHTKKLSFNSAQRIAGAQYTFGLDAEDSKNDFEYLNNNGTPVANVSDDFTKKRKNNDKQDISLQNALHFKFDDLRISLEDRLQYKEEGVPGVDTVQAQYVRRNVSSNTVSSKFLFLQPFGLNAEYALTYFYTLKNDSYKDVYGEIFTDISILENAYSTHGLTFLQSYFFFNPDIEVLVNTSYTRDGYKRREVSVENEINKFPEQLRNALDLALELRLRLLDESLLLNAQYRESFAWDYFYDDYSYSLTDELNRDERYNREYALYFGAKYYLFDSLYFVKGSVARNFRMPNFTELFGSGAYAKGNSTLSNEHSLTVDAGLGCDIEAKSFTFYIDDTLFYSEIEDIILYIANSQLTVKPYNASSALVYGNELSFGLTMFSHLALGGNYTYQLAKDDGDVAYYKGKYLPHRPLHEARGYSRLYNQRAALEYNLEYIGYSFRDRANSQMYYVDSRLIHSIAASLSPLKELTLRFEAKNITDVLAYDVIGYPLPGRSFYGSTSWKF